MSDVESLMAKAEAMSRSAKHPAEAMSRSAKNPAEAMSRSASDSASDRAKNPAANSAKTFAKTSARQDASDSATTQTQDTSSTEVRWVLEPHDPEQDRKALEHLADRCQWFSPRVGLELGSEPDGLRLEIGRAACWFGSEQKLVEQLLGWLVRAGYWPRIAVADTLGMAWGWARFARVSCGQCEVKRAVHEQAETEATETDAAATKHSATHERRSRNSSHKTRSSDWEMLTQQPPTPEQRAAAQERASLRQWKRKPTTTATRQRTTWLGGTVMSPTEMQAWADEMQHRHWLEGVEREVLGSTMPESRDESRLLSAETHEASESGQDWSQLAQATRSPALDKTTELRSYPLPCLAPAGDQKAFGDLPVEALKLDGATCEILRQLGIERVHQLGSLPRDGLATRLGSHVLLRWDQVWGRAEETWQTFHATPELRCELDLEIPSADRTVVESWLEEVLRRVVERLWERRRGALRLRVTLRGVSGVVGAWGLDLFRPTIELKHLRELLKFQAERQPPRGAVTGIEIEVLLEGRLETHQQELFEDGSLDRRAAGSLIESLSGRLGRERVIEVVLRGDPQPEKAFTTRPVTGSGRSRLNRVKARYLQMGPSGAMSSSTRSSTRSGLRATPLKKPPSHALPLPSSATPATRLPSDESATPAELSHDEASREEASLLEAREWSHVLRRPLRCWQRPVPLEVIALAEHGPPAAFRFIGKAWRVAGFWGPERIETSWWRGPWVRRDYYRVETEDGYRFWIFRCLESKDWFLHGAF